MTYKPEPRYSHLSLGPSKQPLPVHSPIFMETVSAVLICSVLFCQQNCCLVSVTNPLTTY